MNYNKVTKNSEVTIKSRGEVPGGTTCGPCVSNTHADCDIADCLCAKNNHVVN